MDRREALKRIAFLTGGALSATTLAGVLNGCTPGDATDEAPQLFSTEQYDFVGAVSERIIPATDTPGAREAGVPAFIDEMAAEWMTSVEREHFLDEIEQARSRAQQAFGSPFTELSEEAQDEFLRQLEQEGREREDEVVMVEPLTAWRGERQPEEPIAQGPGQPEEVEVRLRPFFPMMKELTFVGYYTSEVGATQELQYVQVPGRYDGCVPLEEVGRAWA